MSLRVVFDTSTLVSAALRPDSNPNRALQTALLSHHVWVSAETLDELGRVLRREKFDRYMKLESRVEFVGQVRRDCVHCLVSSEAFAGARGVCRDANDDRFLALCIAAHADILVSSDNDLLVLHPWRGTPILTPAQFVHQFSSDQLFPMSHSPALIPYIEPWLRGTHSDRPAVGRAVLHALDLALDDLAKWTDALTDAEVHTQPLGLTSVAFHLRHIARSTDRILSYAEGNQLSAEQLAALKAEQSGDEGLAALLAEVEASFSNASDRIRVLATANFDTPRGVGRKQLPTSIGGALIHVADHTQRHVGQVVTTAKVLKALRA